jgi:hypothetical protein
MMQAAPQCSQCDRARVSVGVEPIAPHSKHNAAWRNMIAGGAGQKPSL